MSNGDESAGHDAFEGGFDIGGPVVGGDQTSDDGQDDFDPDEFEPEPFPSHGAGGATGTGGERGGGGSDPTTGVRGAPRGGGGGDGGGTGGEQMQTEAEEQPTGPLTGSHDPRFRGDVFRSPAQQELFIGQFETQIRHQFDDPGIEFRARDFEFERTDRGGVRGAVAGSGIVANEALRRDVEQDIERQFEERLGVDVTRDDFRVVATETGGIQGVLTDDFVQEQQAARRQRLRAQLEQDLEEQTGRELDQEDIVYREEDGQLIAEVAEEDVGVGEQAVVEDGQSFAAGMAPPTDPPDVSFAAGQVSPGATVAAARLALEQDLEEELGGVDLDADDIEFEEQDGRIVATLTESGRVEVAAQTQPLVQLTEGTPVGGLFRRGAEIGAEIELAAARRRDKYLLTAEDLGLEDEQRAVEDLRQDVSIKTAALSAGVDVDTEEIADRAEAVAVFGGVGLPAAALDRVGVDITDTGLPSPVDEPEKFAVAAAPVAVVEPTPVGEAAIAGTLLAGGAFAAAELFEPEQEIPEGGEVFVSELDIEPPATELPELLTPTDASVGEGAPVLTPPEIAQPTEPGRTFAAEIPLPDETGRNLFDSEVPLPELTAASAIQQARQTQRDIQRETGGRRSGPTVPEEFIPSGTVTIGGEASQPSVGPGGGLTVVRRPSPRSFELREIESETPFRVDPELSRFLAAQELDSSLEAEIDTYAAAGTLDVPEETVRPLPYQEQVDRELEDVRQRVGARELIDQATTPSTTVETRQAQRQATRPAVDQTVGQDIVDVGREFAEPFETGVVVEEVTFVREGLGLQFVEEFATLDRSIRRDIDSEIEDDRLKREGDLFTRPFEFEVTETPGADIDEAIEKIGEDTDDLFKEL